MHRFVVGILVGADAAAAPMTPEVQPDVALVQTTPLERVRYVDAEDTLFGTTGCQRPGGAVEVPTLAPTSALAPDPSGVGLWELSGQLETSIDLVRVRCGEPAETVTLSVDGPFTPGFAVNFGVSSANEVCLPVNEGVLCGALDGGSLALEVPIQQLMDLLPPVADEVAASDGQLPDGATYARVEVLSVLRSDAHSRWFLAGRVRFLHPLGAELPFAAGVVFQWTDAGDPTLHLGPGTGGFDAAAWIESLTLDAPAGLVYASAGMPTAAFVVPGGFGERVYLPPAIGVFAADGRPSLGVINWQNAHGGLSADLALGNTVRVIPSYSGMTIWKPAANPTANPLTSVWRLTIDPDGVDHDGDALTHERELAEGTDPVNVDSDRGGVEDGMEVARGTDPTDPSDDGLSPALSDEVDWGISLLDDPDPTAWFIGSPFRFGKRFCGDPDCFDRLGERVGDIDRPVLTHDGRGVYGFAGSGLVERRFDGGERAFATSSTGGLIVPFPEGFLLGDLGVWTYFTHDGTARAVDFAAEACDGPCDALLGSSGFEAIGQDPATDDLLVLYRGNEEFITYLWHPDRGLTVVGRNRLMPVVGGLMGQLQRCLYTTDGTCLGTYLIASGLAFPYQVDGRTLQVVRPFRADIDGNPIEPAWQDTFRGYLYPDTGAILDARWVRIEDRIAPGDVLHANSGGRLTLHRVDPWGGVLPLYGDVWLPPAPENPPSIFPGLGMARGLGAAGDGRICFVGQDGTYAELHHPDGRGRPRDVVFPVPIPGAIDCGFDAEGVTHVLATNPPRIERVDARLAEPQLGTVPLPGGAPSHLRVRPDGIDVVAYGPSAPIQCVDATGASSASFHAGYATAQTPDGVWWLIDATTRVVGVTGDVCSPEVSFPESPFQFELNPAAPSFDLEARPDGRLVAVGLTSHILTPRGEQSYVSGLFVPYHGALASVPGGTWEDPFAAVLVQPDFADPPGTDTDEASDPPGARDGGCCRTASSPVGGLLTGLAAGLIGLRRRQSRSRNDGALIP